MSFLPAVSARIAALPPTEPERIFLEFMEVNAVGRANSKAWSIIESHLHTRGIILNQRQFQQGILKRTREGNVYIGSNDHGVGRGYFIIDEIEDAELMRNWYQTRIDRENVRLAHLRSVAALSGWTI